MEESLLFANKDRHMHQLSRQHCDPNSHVRVAVNPHSMVFALPDFLEYVRVREGEEASIRRTTLGAFEKFVAVALQEGRITVHPAVAEAHVMVRSGHSRRAI
jgi:hypothetical protein